MYLSKKLFTHTTTFWLLLCCVSLAGIFFSWRFFARAFPIVDLEITMDRQQALHKAKEIAQQLKLMPQNYKQAVSFDSDSNVQNFIELEAGGPKEFSNILKEGYYAPYFWKVRHFKEYDADETELTFTPDGRPYGFVQKIAEDEIGAALSTQEAQKIAVHEAELNWKIDFSNYKLVEAGQEKTSKDRIDHSFVFERIDKKVGEAPYRLKLVVRGDRLTELTLSVKVPENFEKKYEEMRSSNNFIAYTALIIMIILYVFCGCFLGLFFLARWSWLEFKWPLYCAFFIGFLQVLNDINQIPFLWFGYDTAVSMQQFIGHIMIKIIYHFFMYISIGLLLITVAEGLTRKAFPRKIQLWKIWSPLAGSSVQVLGRTLGGYLFIGIDLAYCIGFYYLALKFLGWWSPSEALYNPNALATYIPWISPIASSLSAGFLEECGFRAIPLAGAALLGDRFGKRNVWIGIAFIMQAIIFGAAHANYPAQPAYARLIELIIPSFIFGFMYLMYGLLPAIISHFTFDVVWFSLPIFISHAPGIFFDKIMIVLMCLVPLLIVFGRRLQHKSWIQLPDQFYNAAWRPRNVAQHNQEIEEDLKIHWPQSRRVLFIALGLLGMVLWLTTTRFIFDTPPLSFTRTEAISTAKTGKGFDSQWTPLVGVEPSLDLNDRNQHVYVWRTFGQDMYKKLLQNYLMPLAFKVRFVRFNGSIDERSENDELFVAGDKKNPVIRRTHHHYPENLLLESLSKEEALKRAYEYVATAYHVSKNDLIEISAVPTQQQQRIDWKFLFNDMRQKFVEGQARIAIEVAGSNVIDAYQFVFVPEQWDRLFKEENALITLLEMVKLLLFIILISFASVLIIYYSRSLINFSLKLFFIIFSILLTKSFIQAINIWPYAIANFKASEPFNYQAWQVIGFWIVFSTFMATLYGLLAGFLYTKRFKSSQAHVSFRYYIGMGFLLGMIDIGFLAYAKSLFSYMNPQWPLSTYAAAYLPWLSLALSMLTNFIEYSILALIIFTALDYATNYLKNYQWLPLLFLMFLGIVMLEIRDFMPWWVLVIVGIVWGTILWFIYFFALRNFRASIPCVIATIKIFEIVPLVVFKAYPGVLLGWLVGSILIGMLALFWSYQMYYSKYSVARSFNAG